MSGFPAQAGDGYVLAQIDGQWIYSLLRERNFRQPGHQTLAPEFTPCAYAWRGRIAIGYPGDSFQPRVGIAVTPPAQPGEIPTVPAHLEEAQLPIRSGNPTRPPTAGVASNSCNSSR